MNAVLDEIQALKKAFGYTEEEAIGWIKHNIHEYCSVFKCDFQRFLTGDSLAKEYGVLY